MHHFLLPHLETSRPRGYSRRNDSVVGKVQPRESTREVPDEEFDDQVLDLSRHRSGLLDRRRRPHAIRSRDGRALAPSDRRGATYGLPRCPSAPPGAPASTEMTATRTARSNAPAAT